MKSHEQPPGVESQEELKEKFLRVFRVRHGSTNYKEHRGIGNEEVDFDLTEKGVEQISHAAQQVAEQLDKGTDIVLMATSERVRAQNSLEVIKNYLTQEGFDVRFDESRSIREWIQGKDILDADGNMIPTNTPKHAETFDTLFEMPEHDLYTRDEAGMRPSLESQDLTDRRTRNHLALLTRFARSARPPDGKYFVVVQAEHLETLSELVSQASGGERTMKAGTGVKKGEVIELDIPHFSDDQNVPIEVKSLGRTGEEPSEAMTVHFDYVSRTFIDSN